jgi:hypothetical protein
VSALPAPKPAERAQMTDLPALRGDSRPLDVGSGRPADTPAGVVRSEPGERTRTFEADTRRAGANDRFPRAAR